MDIRLYAFGSKRLWMWVIEVWWVNHLFQCNYSWWRHQMETFPRYWPFVRGIHRWPVNSSNKGQWRRALMFSLICAWMNGWVNNHEAGDLRRHLTHYDVIVMWDMPISGAPCSLAVWFRLTKPICAWIFHWKLTNKGLFLWQYQHMNFEMVG